ncbi:N-alpha-acetyltransferase, non-catalitic subunit, partial [Coemansia erecta]
MSRLEDDQQRHTRSSSLVSRDTHGNEWLDITELMTLGTSELQVGELLKPESMTLYTALTSMEVMEPRLDMGMLTEEDKIEISKWDLDRVLTLREVLWITEKLFYCEMTWHNSASLLQTLYMCNYFTVQEVPPLVGCRRAENCGRDVVLFPMIFALGACCLQVWMEYLKENVYAEEDVHFGSQPVEFFRQFSHSQVVDMLDTARLYLKETQETCDDPREQAAAAVLLDYLEMRVVWLKSLVYLSVDYLTEDPGALDRSSECLKELQTKHKEFLLKPVDPELAVAVAGCFDPKCMRKYPSMAPVKPRPLLTHQQSHQAFDALIKGLSLIHPLLQAESVEELINFFADFANRQPTPLPFVRSLVVSVFLTNDSVLLRHSPVAFIKRAIREVSGPYVWDVLECIEREPMQFASRSKRFAQMLGQDPMMALSRVDGFCQEAARNLMDWFRTMCQNAPRQRRISLKYLASWDVLQGDAEELDAWFYVVSCGPESRQPEEESLNPAFNPFWFSSWTYHMKLLLMENGLQAGVRLDLYLDYELPLIYGYSAQILQSHFDHLRRMQTMIASKAGQNSLFVGKPQADLHVGWVRRRVGDSACLQHLARWLVFIETQCQLATALWLVSHACDRLGIIRAPWARRRLQGASLEVLEFCQKQESLESQAVRFALRFRSFSRLNSPTPLTFAGWMTTVGQLDESSASELFVHASRTLGKARKTLDEQCGNLIQSDSGGWQTKYQELRYVAVANAVALAKLQAAPAAMQCSALKVPGSQALVFRQMLVEMQLGELKNQADKNQATLSKSKAKREKKKKKR